MKYLEKHPILNDVRHRFRREQSCEPQPILSIQDLGRNVDIIMDLILLDISKAFDKLPNERVKYKIHHYGIGDTNLT